MENLPPGVPHDPQQMNETTDNSQIANISEMIRTLRVPDTSVSKELSGFLENGKLNYIEPRIRFENHPSINEYIMKFRNMRSIVEASPVLLQKLPEIEHGYRDLIAALVQESDEKINLLSVRINSMLSPWIRKENAVDYFSELIERTIRAVAHRERYGVKHSAITSIEGAPISVPNHLAFSRWEINDISNFPLDLQQVIEARRSERRKMSESVTEIFSSLSQEQKLSILSTKPRRTQTKAPVDTQMSEELRKAVEENEQEKEEKRKKKEEEKIRRDEEKRLREEERKKREEEKKSRDEERKKREEEKKQRDEERKKKEQSQLRLTSLFTKPKEEKPTGTLLYDSAMTPKSTLFQPFFVKEFTTMSVPNPTIKQSDKFEEVLKGYSTILTSSPPNESVGVRERFRNELKSRGPKTSKKRGVQRKINLRTVWLGPGLSGANADFLNNQSLNSLVKMKLLHFPEDVRPAYYGTWTKSSQSISGRTPFARDEKLVDYEHDSEAEWEPEGEGEDIQSGDEDEEDFGADTVDPEDASWLVPEGYVSDSERINSDEEDGYSEQESKGTGHSLPLRPPTRKNMASGKKIIGPYFENDSDTSDEETLRPYKTKMCIDVEEGYDPFAVLDGTNSSNGAKTSSFVKEHTDALISVILSKPGNMKLLVSEAKSHEALKDISRRHIESKIKEIAVKEKRGKDTKAIWHIK